MADTAPNRQPRPTVEIIEVSARDGIQNEDVLLSTDTKLALIEAAVAAGLGRIEAVSFAHPTRVPQMADAEAVLTRLGHRPGVTFTALVLNERGYDRALAAGAQEINMVVTTTDTFADRNQGSSVRGLVDGWLRIAERAHRDGIRPTIGISMAFGCPYEGEVPVERLVQVAEAVLAGDPAELGIADSIGCGVPTDVAERFAAVAAIAPDVTLRAHFHNTRNTGLANAVAAVEAGVTVLDSSLGGIGGCPFAPNATGNVPTEDLVYLLHRMGHDTGIDLDRLCAVVPWIEEALAFPARIICPRSTRCPRSERCTGPRPSRARDIVDVRREILDQAAAQESHK